MEFIFGFMIGVILMCCLVVGGDFDYKTKWDELKKWLLCMQEISHLDSNCLGEVLSKMNRLEVDEEDE